MSTPFPVGAAATDIILVRNMLPWADRVQSRPIPLRRIAIGSDLWIGPIPHAIQELVLKACRAPGVNFDPVRHESYKYGIYRMYRAVPSARYDFDADRRLALTLLLSRVVRPTSASFQVAARVLFDRPKPEVYPLECSGPGSSAWTSRPARDWLTPADCRESVGSLNSVTFFL